MAPVAGGVAHREQDGLALLAGLLEGLLAPRVPVHGISSCAGAGTGCAPSRGGSPARAPPGRRRLGAGALAGRVLALLAAGAHEHEADQEGDDEGAHGGHGTPAGTPRTGAWRAKRTKGRAHERAALRMVLTAPRGARVTSAAAAGRRPAAGCCRPARGPARAAAGRCRPARAAPWAPCRRPRESRTRSCDATPSADRRPRPP